MFVVSVKGTVQEENIARTKDGGGISYFKSNWNDVADKTSLTEAEKLCFNVLPKNFGINNAEIMPEVLKSPLWQEVLDFCTVADTMVR